MHSLVFLSFESSVNFHFFFVMFSHCSSPAVAADPCAPRQNDASRLSKSNYYQSSLCYRPLQQLYKTMYSPVQGTQASPFNRACICRPSERYTTTNMTYGSFYYNNWSFIQKNRSGVARCEDQMKKRE